MYFTQFLYKPFFTDGEFFAFSRIDMELFSDQPSKIALHFR